MLLSPTRQLKLVGVLVRVARTYNGCGVVLPRKTDETTLRKGGMRSSPFGRRMEREINGYQITDDRRRVDLDFVERMLRDTYWAADRSRKRMAMSIENSICFSVFHGDTQVGFARVVTDSCTFAWLGDVVVDPQHRRRGLGRALVEFMLDHPDVRDATQQLLRTNDAQGLYERYGFSRAECMSRKTA